MIVIPDLVISVTSITCICICKIIRGILAMISEKNIIKDMKKKKNKIKKFAKINYYF